MKRLMPVFAFLALAAMACNLGAVQPTTAPRPTYTVQPTIMQSATVQPTVAVQPTLASGNINPPVRANPTVGAGFCAASLPVRLTVGGKGRVTPGDPNTVRSQPTRDNASSRILGQIPGGGTFTVITGPQCANNLTWWQVNYNGLIGWTPEGEGTTYWLEPVAGTGPITVATSMVVNPACPSLTPRLFVGGQGRVTPGDANVIRSGVGKTGTTVLGQIPAGGVFSVVGSPACADNIVWWDVIYNGIRGWTGEGQGSTYWTEPVGVANTSTCDGVSPARVKMGYQARVVSSDPAVIVGSALQPAQSTVGTVPSGATLTISGGSQCTSGTRYWQVNYNGLNGWLAEVSGTTNPYQIAPSSPPTGACPAGSAPKLVLGSNGRVTPGQPNVMRTGPSKTGTSVSGQIPAGGTFVVLDGPFCGDSFRWWKVMYNEQVGWTADGDGVSAWVEPLPDAIVCPFVARLTVGGIGRVTPGQPNRIRSGPSMAQGSILGQIPAGATFSVLDGPRCLSGSRWWKVAYNGITGWTADADSSGYWLEPFLP